MCTPNRASSFSKKLSFFHPVLVLFFLFFYCIVIFFQSSPSSTTGFFPTVKLARMDLLRATDALTSAHAALEIATELESPRLQVQAMQLLVKESWLRRSLRWSKKFRQKIYPVPLLREFKLQQYPQDRNEWDRKSKQFCYIFFLQTICPLFQTILEGGGSEI